jgi:hypothetical protein
MTDKVYQEGDQPEQVQDSHSDKVRSAPVTAVLLIKNQEGSVDIVTEIGGIDMQRPPTMADILDMGLAVTLDAYANVIAQKTSFHVANAIAQARQMQQPQVTKGPGGVPIIGRGGRGPMNGGH